MQTFLPYPDFAESAACLDYRRLGKQRVETMQILSALNSKTGKAAWVSHPATIMWKGFSNALVEYGISICNEWIGRGYKDTCLDKILNYSEGGEIILPPWIGDVQFHASHRSNLLRKNKEFYSKFGWSEPDNLPYIWPKGEIL